MHPQIDVKPLVLEDEIGLQLIAPDESWKQRPDMIGKWTKNSKHSSHGFPELIWLNKGVRIKIHLLLT